MAGIPRASSAAFAPLNGLVPRNPLDKRGEGWAAVRMMCLVYLPGGRFSELPPRLKDTPLNEAELAAFRDRLGASFARDQTASA